MLYYYANTGHKIGLDRVKRAVALLKALNDKGVETRLLVNDFRAGLAARELGLRDYVTIEGVMDIDAIADTGDSIIMDTPEDDRGRIQKYCSDFSHVFRFANSSEDEVRVSEVLFKPECDDENCIEALIVDSMYESSEPKKERVLFFLSDADYDKEILSNKEFFQNAGMELLLGNYFFVKYEDELAEIFERLHEAEEYEDLLKTSSHIVTASGQTALEAHVCGAKVVYINTAREDIIPLSVIKGLDIPVIEGFNRAAYEGVDKNQKSEKTLNFSVDQISDQLIDRLKS
ncbi:hypothetical protein PGH07_08835 [Sulfurovum sp. zt1-1]|uniref:UDP-2,4-diacetamido-2,4,6-trideoxy-beta-L-altropyranose hydrolase n=1 Tax=Sulfurovum zhangzhouensis TaxID=3019067 RepID=A0ABT7QZK7_9BACT|nr:hypothetical protein [Sulfurovum zhangzhouensis]MDM5272285.1 hypothetical protein [Sulfurovum zhangzhouensis]